MINTDHYKEYPALINLYDMINHSKRKTKLLGSVIEEYNKILKEVNKTELNTSLKHQVFEFTCVNYCKKINGFKYWNREEKNHLKNYLIAVKRKYFRGLKK